MKLWIDDIRKAPKGYIWCTSVNEAMVFIYDALEGITEINLDHDAGIMSTFGGDFIRILDNIEEYVHEESINMENCIFKFHSANPVGVANMKRICEKNNWNYK